MVSALDKMYISGGICRGTLLEKKKYEMSRQIEREF